MKQRIVPDQLPQHLFPVHPWRFIEREFARDLLPLTETLFCAGNGYLGLRGDHDEGRGACDPGTFVNGFHETWSIHHAEEAFGFATTGQTIVNAPDAKIDLAVGGRRAVRPRRGRPRRLRAGARHAPGHGEPRAGVADAGGQGGAGPL